MRLLLGYPLKDIGHLEMAMPHQSMAIFRASSSASLQGHAGLRLRGLGTWSFVVVCIYMPEGVEHVFTSFGEGVCLQRPQERVSKTLFAAFRHWSPSVPKSASQYGGPCSGVLPVRPSWGFPRFGGSHLLGFWGMEGASPF